MRSCMIDSAVCAGVPRFSALPGVRVAVYRRYLDGGIEPSRDNPAPLLGIWSSAPGLSGFSRGPVRPWDVLPGFGTTAPASSRLVPR